MISSADSWHIKASDHHLIQGFWMTMKAIGVVLIFLVALAAAGPKQPILPDGIFKEKTVPQVWHLLTEGKEAKLKQAMLSALSPEDVRSNEAVTQLVNMIFPAEDQETCQGCGVSTFNHIL